MNPRVHTQAGFYTWLPILVHMSHMYLYVPSTRQPVARRVGAGGLARPSSSAQGLSPRKWRCGSAGPATCGGTRAPEGPGRRGRGADSRCGTALRAEATW